MYISHMFTCSRDDRMEKGARALAAQAWGLWATSEESLSTSTAPCHAAFPVLAALNKSVLTGRCLVMGEMVNTH